MGVVTAAETTMSAMSVYELGYRDERIVDVHGKQFDPEQYSRFKYGDGEAAQHYAVSLADELLERYGDDIGDMYIAGSASKHVPTAAQAISNALIGELSLRGHAPTGAFRIDRAVVREGDYSALSDSERELLAHNNGLTVPPETLREMADCPVMIIDDIKVTGSHEAALRQVLGSAGLKSVLFSYIASVEPEVAATRPQIEYDVNHAFVKELQDVTELAEEPLFVLNARTCKYILQSDSEAITCMVERMPLSRSMQMLSAMTADGYHLLPTYKESFTAFTDAAYEKAARTRNG